MISRFLRQRGFKQYVNKKGSLEQHYFVLPELADLLRVATLSSVSISYMLVLVRGWFISYINKYPFIHCDSITLFISTSFQLAAESEFRLRDKYGRSKNRDERPQ